MRFKTNRGEERYHTPYYWAQFLQTKLTTSPEKIMVMPDTIIGRASYFHIKIVMKHSASSKQIHDLCLNKSNYLPVYIKQYLQGRFCKGEMTRDNIASMNYNELGQLIDKKLEVNGTAFLQSVDYCYNIRGQLLSINNSKRTTDATT